MIEIAALTMSMLDVSIIVIDYRSLNGLRTWSSIRKYLYILTSFIRHFYCETNY